jgi:hypothetical protein
MVRLAGADGEHDNPILSWEDLIAWYRFQISDRGTAFFDQDGINLPDPSDTIEEAAATAWMLICELSHEVSDWSAWRVNVVDENDSTVLALPIRHFINAVEVRHIAHDSAETIR